MRGKFPIGIYYLNRFLQASIISIGSYRPPIISIGSPRHLLSQWIPTGIYVVFIQGFALSPSLGFGDVHFFSVIFFMLHRVIEWVDFDPIFESPAAFVVVAVGMWATRLRCPSCAQRCLSYGHDLIEGGAALLIAISMTDEGPMDPATQL